MRSMRYFAVLIVVSFALAITTGDIAQSVRVQRKSRPQKKQDPSAIPTEGQVQLPAEAATETSKEAPTQAPSQSTSPVENTIKIDVDLVNVPVIASNGSDVYVYDLQKEDFALTEDGVKQEIVFFGEVREPFHVVLML